MTDSFDTMKAQKDAILARESEFLHKRRGELVIERDRALRALAEMVACFDAHTPWPHDAEEGSYRMERACADAKAILQLHGMHSPEAQLGEDE